MTQASRSEIVIAAVDKATATLSLIAGKLDSITAPAANLSKALGKLYQATGLAAVKTAVGGLTSSVGGLITTTGAIAGVYSGAIGSVIGFANHAVEAADKIGDLSEKYQINSEALQVYGEFVKEDGGSIEDAAASIGKLKRAMNEALHGGKEQAAAFAGVGISLAELKAMKPEEVMLRMADAFKGSEQDMAKQAVLLQLMGKQGEAMMGAMNRGAEEYRRKLGEMRQDGRILVDQQKKVANDFSNAWQRMGGTLEGVKNTLGLKLAEKLLPLVESVQKWVVANRALIESKFDQFLAKLPRAIEIGAELLEGLWGVVEKVGSAFKWLSDWIGPTATVLLALGTILSPVIMAAWNLFAAVGGLAWRIGGLALQALPALMTGLRAVWAVMVANPIGLLLAAIVGLAVIVYQNWDAIVGYVTQAWERIKAVFEVNFFSGLWQAALEGFQLMLNGIVSLIKKLMPDFLLSDTLKNFEFTFATDRAKNITAAQAAAAQRQDIKNELRIRIDAEGRPRVTEMKSGSPQTQLDVSTGPMMVGA